MRIKICIAALTLWGATSRIEAQLRSTANLSAIQFVERTGSTFQHEFPALSGALMTRLPDPLGSSNADFHGVPNKEFYDVFYSDADGTLNVDGDYLTVEAAFEQPTGGGGLNIDEILLRFDDCSRHRASVVTSAVYLGPNSIAGSAANAVDGVLGNHSTMGSTTGTQRLRITVGTFVPFDVQVCPALPTHWFVALGGAALLGGIWVLRRRPV